MKDVRTGEVVSQLCTDFSIVEPAEYWDFFPLEIHDVITCGELFGAPAEIGWTVDASGGMGPLKYRYRVFQSGVSAPVEESDWIDSDTYTYHTAGEGYYTVEVTVKDKNGKGESVSMTCGNLNEAHLSLLPHEIRSVRFSMLRTAKQRGMPATGAPAERGGKIKRSPVRCCKGRCRSACWRPFRRCP